MSEKEYIVTLTVDADPSSFQADMTQNSGDYTSSTSTGRYLQGAPDRYLYSPFPGQYKFRIQNS